MLTPIQTNRQSSLSSHEADLARASGQHLSQYLGRTSPLTIRVVEAGREQQSLELPAGAVSVLMEILEVMAAGHGVTIIPENAELTTVQAASVLNVSRPYLIKLLSDGALPYRKVGKHRRVLMEDVMNYKKRIDQQREAVLDQLAADAQKNEMGYGHS